MSKKPLKIAYKCFFADHNKEEWVYYSTAKLWADVIEMIDEVLFCPQFVKYGRVKEDYYYKLFENSCQKPERIMITVETDYTLTEGEELYDKDRDYYLDE